MKRITLDIDAYEKLRSAKRPGESFSDVVRRATFDVPIAATPGTGAWLREYYRRGGSGMSEEYLDSVEQAIRHDPPPDDPWA